MKKVVLLVPGLILGISLFHFAVYAYPPAVGITGNSPNCLACHVSNGPWADDEYLVLDILDKESGSSLRQADGSFVVEVPRNQTRTVLTVMGRKSGDNTNAPYRNAWLYVDPSTIGNAGFSTFPAGWEVNLPMACRIVGDKSDSFPGAAVTVLPMRLRATDAAQDGVLMLQAMLTYGEAVKGKANEGMIGNYYERIVQLLVKEGEK